MATKAKAPAKKVTKTAAKAPAKAPAKAAKAPAKAPAKKAVATKTPVKKTAAAATTVRPIKEALNKSQLVAHLVEATGVEAKSVKTVLAALEGSVLGSIDKKGAGEFTMPGLFKISVQKVPAKAKRFGKDPFTGQERWFPAKPASVKVKVRPLKKLKDAAQ
ncbi:HU family DNA-binding protein [Bordetella genomosp. 13]|uniref:HU family DNA-binding protein n=1 Tax=Bordetella genomosp. 13 TaxID=463040 RepID=UPI0011A23966|nr:HU family DNA-binding protein [Bordetella genomosp. 13]